MTEFADRSRPAHHSPVERGHQSIIVFLTVCTHARKPVLARDDVHELMRTVWRSGHWRVGRYVLMPDHVHLFCSPGTHPPTPLSSWVKYWKSMVSNQWPRPGEHPVWQRDYWDTQLRPHDHYGERWEYVRQNPVRAGLVNQADSWPYQGEIETLMWRDA
jgi:putative transposase